MHSIPNLSPTPRETKTGEQTVFKAFLLAGAFALAGLTCSLALAQDAPAAQTAPAAKAAPQKAKPKPEPKKPAKKAAPQPVAASPPPPVILPNPPLPVQQAAQLGLGACVPMLTAMSGQVLTSNYNVQSAWNQQDPANHIFQSVAALNTPQNVPPDGMAALIAVPDGKGSCEGATLQVFPLAGPCSNAEKLLLQGGQKLGSLLNASILLNANRKRLFLLPGFANTCIAIGVDSTFSTP